MTSNSNCVSSQISLYKNHSSHCPPIKTYAYNNNSFFSSRTLQEIVFNNQKKAIPAVGTKDENREDLGSHSSLKSSELLDHRGLPFFNSKSFVKNKVTLVKHNPLKQTKLYNQSFKIFHQNSQCASNKLNMLNLLCMELDPEFFVISEHWYCNNNSKYFNLDNYVLGDIFCRSNSKGGNVSIFVKSNVKFERNTLSQLSQDKHFEISSVTFKISSRFKLTLVGLYRSPNGSTDLFFDQFEQLLNALSKKSETNKFLIVGGFNLNVLNVSDKNVKSFKDLLNTFNLVWSIDSPTRVVGNFGTAIDNVVSNMSSKLEISTLNTAISDDFGQEIILKNCSIDLEPFSSLKKELQARKI